MTPPKSFRRRRHLPTEESPQCRFSKNRLGRASLRSCAPWGFLATERLGTTPPKSFRRRRYLPTEESPQSRFSKNRLGRASLRSCAPWGFLATEQLGMTPPKSFRRRRHLPTEESPHCRFSNNRLGRASLRSCAPRGFLATERLGMTCLGGFDSMIRISGVSRNAPTDFRTGWDRGNRPRTTPPKLRQNPIIAHNTQPNHQGAASRCPETACFPRSA